MIFTVALDLMLLQFEKEYMKCIEVPSRQWIGCIWFPPFGLQPLVSFHFVSEVNYTVNYSCATTGELIQKNLMVRDSIRLGLTAEAHSMHSMLVGYVVRK